MEFKKILDSDFKVIPPFIAEALAQIKKEFAPSQQEIFDLKLALEESITNAIKHGNKAHRDLNVEVTIRSRKNRLLLKVRDHGQGFDYRKVPDPTRQDRLMKTSGRGIFLIKKTMDEVTFLKNGREIRMVKVLKAKS